MENKYILKKLIDIIQLSQEINKKGFEDIYDGLNINEVHTIDYIKRNTSPNVTSIASNLNITRGGATKITKKLISKGYINEYKVAENKKEKYFILTASGEKIFIKHEKTHEESLKNDSKLFDVFTETEKHIITKFLDVLKDDLKDKLV